MVGGRGAQLVAAGGRGYRELARTMLRVTSGSRRRRGEATVMWAGGLRQGCRGSSGRGGGDGGVVRWVQETCDRP
uniref:Uncharacterized protein n=1 Tax=Oryza meridionalis TaxID=40149 RepID=A0A0E0CP45_9ORYZ